MDDDEILLGEMDRMSRDLAIAADWCRMRHPNAPPYPWLAVAYLRDDGEILLLVGAMSAIADCDLPTIRTDAQWALETLGYIARPYLVFGPRMGVTVTPGGGSAHERAAGLARLLKASLAEHRSEHR
ncbi:hypothetical protein SAMN05444413_1173 [Roseivivax marinus]|uniref:hypothetical protein n=1 Tax=Roseivivax marinus TaxID=1379903 RepID=UPI0008C970F9|nr:hypothetical protein [Roseivivax marinus]SEL81230.1 hypothetical protein SAMN05444413_1173 [Roseivivax marinus]